MKRSPAMPYAVLGICPFFRATGQMAREGKLTLEQMRFHVKSVAGCCPMPVFGRNGRDFVGDTAEEYWPRMGH
jgi:hypothetical protein